MAETSATILIPDISGFTEFVTHTELAHSSLAINMLMDAMVNAVGETYEIVEIEGDAILMIRKDILPSKKEILDTCLKIFNAFHFQRKWMQDYTICPCGACQALVDLTLKFVVHYGPLAEIKVGRFLKPSGKEMIVAHRLLKNSIDNHEYLLLTDTLWDQAVDSAEIAEMEWASSSEEYEAIGKVGYRFTLLNKARKKVSEPPAPQNTYAIDNTPSIEIPIASDYLSVYMTIMNIPGRAAWLHGLQKVEQDIANVFIGSVHRCTFENYEAVISPRQMTVSTYSIMYAESCQIKKMDLAVICEFEFKKINVNACILSFRYMNAGENTIPGEKNNFLSEKMQGMAEDLKKYCEEKG